MDVNSAAFKKKCVFALNPRYELFLSLSAAASKFPGELPEFKPWDTDVSNFIKKINPVLRVGLSLSSVVSSFFPSNEIKITPEQMFRHLEGLNCRDFVYFFLEGFLHDQNVCEDVVDRKISLKKAINSIGAKKREWLTYLRLYPFNPDEKIIQFFEWLIKDQVKAKGELIQIYKIWWDKYFSFFWNSRKDIFRKSIKTQQERIESLEFDEFANKVLLKIRIGSEGNTLEAMRGGYKISCKDIDDVVFMPSIFNTDRLWSAIERPNEKKVLFFPYLDLDIIHHFGKAVPLSRLDAALMCRAIGDPTRYALLMMLSTEPQPAVTLAQKLDLTRATVSHHISVLREAGVLSDNGAGRKLQINWENLLAMSEALVKSLKHQRTD